MTTIRNSQPLAAVARSTALILLAVLFTSQLVLAAPRKGNLRLVEPELSAPQREKIARPTRPAKMEPSQPIIGSEVFVERFDDGSIKVEREVTLDDGGNYVNHGPWRMWNKAGQLVAEGSFDYGKRTSIWTRWLDRNESPLLSQSPFRRFKAPFLSQVNFDDGIMNGEWSVFDTQQNRCCQISISQGKRDGMSLFWLPDGTVMLQSMFTQGVPTGDVLQLDPKSGKLAQAKHFLNGREVLNRKSMVRRGGPVKFEGNYLAPTSVQTTADDFWTLQFAQYEPQGEEMRHGKWQEWHGNGQLKMSGQFNYNKKVGQFTFWHSNGQKAAEGDYAGDKYDGNWVWWHQNGQKSVTGCFRNDKLVDQWRWWTESGKLAKQAIHDGTESYEILAEERLPDQNKSARSKSRVQR